VWVYDEVVLDANDVVVAGVELLDIEGSYANGDGYVGFLLVLIIGPLHYIMKQT